MSSVKESKTPKAHYGATRFFRSHRLPGRKKSHSRRPAISRDSGSTGSLPRSPLVTELLADSDNERADNAPGLTDSAEVEFFDRSDHASGLISSAEFPYFSDRDVDGNSYSSQDPLTTIGQEEQALLRATVFVEDAIAYRSIHHKIDPKSLIRYRLYHSKVIQWLLRITIAVLLSLAFVEFPSSLTSSSDPRKIAHRWRPPCGATESIESVCLIILTVDLVFKILMIGRRQAKRSNWLIVYGIVLVVSHIDWLVSVGYVCNETWRIRRILRPFFLVQNSSVMKKTVRSIKQSVAQILSVLFLLCLHLYFFVMLGMVLFSPRNFENANNRSQVTATDVFTDVNEGLVYFKDLGTSVMSLLVLLTTANNPDVMMPAYSHNRFYGLYFVLYLAIGMYFFMHVLLAVIYNQFKGSFSKSMQSSFFRRRCGIRAAFEVLRGSAFSRSSFVTTNAGISTSVVKQLLAHVRFSKKSRYMPFLLEYLNGLPGVTTAKQFQECFDIVFKDSIKKRPPCRQFQSKIYQNIQSVLLHIYFQYFGDFVSLVNVLVVTIELSTSVDKAFSGHSMLAVFNFCFIFYYAVEQTVMIVFVGPRRYFSHKHICFESFITWLLVLVEVLSIALYGGPFPYLTDQEILDKSTRLGLLSLWNLLRIGNMLIIIRLLRIIPSIKPLSVIASTLVDLIKNLRAFAGVLVLIYYVFGILGMMIFAGRSPAPPPVIDERNTSMLSIGCGTYEQLGYYANNFDDFAASLMVLWDVMVVNNWHVYLMAYSVTTGSRYAQIYFVGWWLISVVVCINLFIALVIEAFITQWDNAVLHDRKHRKRKFAYNEETSHHFRVHQLFQAELQEPKESDILRELWSHYQLRNFILFRANDAVLA